MHLYLRAIGFQNIQTKVEQRELLKQVEKKNSQSEILVTPSEEYIEYKKLYSNEIGVAIFGENNEDDNFYPEYYYPFLESKTISSYDDIVVNRKKDSDSYMGICEDVRIGVSIIFYLQNPLEYMKVMTSANPVITGTSLSLAGLALAGTVLLPIAKTENNKKNDRQLSINRKMLVAASKFGDVETVEEMEKFFNIPDRVKQEDIFSIVDTYFIPYGIECDEYSILGEIKELRIVENKSTGVELYHMLLEINEMEIELCVPVSEVLGEPAVSRRFKAHIWLQGRINFPE